MGSDMFGAAGDDIMLKMPVGTMMIDAETNDVLYELLTPGEVIMIAKGGDGGFGNMRFKSAINRAPRQKTPGWPGERKNLKLVLPISAPEITNGHAPLRSIKLKRKLKLITICFIRTYIIKSDPSTPEHKPAAGIGCEISPTIIDRTFPIGPLKLGL
jgi:hypothetical protein